MFNNFKCNCHKSLRKLPIAQIVDPICSDKHIVKGAHSPRIAETPVLVFPFFKKLTTAANRQKFSKHIFNSLQTK